MTTYLEKVYILGTDWKATQPVSKAVTRIQVPTGHPGHFGCWELYLEDVRV